MSEIIIAYRTDKSSWKALSMCDSFAVLSYLSHVDKEFKGTKEYRDYVGHLVSNSSSIIKDLNIIAVDESIHKIAEYTQFTELSEFTEYIDNFNKYEKVVDMRLIYYENDDYVGSEFNIPKNKGLANKLIENSCVYTPLFRVTGNSIKESFLTPINKKFWGDKRSPKYNDDSEMPRVFKDTERLISLIETGDYKKIKSPKYINGMKTNVGKSTMSTIKGFENVGQKLYITGYSMINNRLVTLMNDNRYFTFDKDNGELIEDSVAVMNVPLPAIIMPKPFNEISVGDKVYYDDKVCFVIKKNSRSYTVIDYQGVTYKLLPIKNSLLGDKTYIPVIQETAVELFKGMKDINPLSFALMDEDSSSLENLMSLMIINNVK